MKVELKMTPDEEIIGVDLVSEHPVDEIIIERFWKGGVKISSYTAIGRRVALTFRDLVTQSALERTTLSTAGGGIVLETADGSDRAALKKAQEHGGIRIR